MTVETYRKQCEENQDNNNGQSFFDFIAPSLELWSNNACYGYAIAALEELGYTKEDIKKFVGEMKCQFDTMTIDEADSHYCHSPY